MQISGAGEQQGAATRREGLMRPAVNPVDGMPFDVLISFDRLHIVAQRSLGQLTDAAYIVPEVLRHPRAIFEGLLRERDDDNRSAGWLCYCAIPERSYDDRGRPRATWPHKVFLVFVNDERVAYLWYWTKCDPEEPHLPEGHTKRFRRRVL